MTISLGSLEEHRLRNDLGVAWLGSVLPHPLGKRTV